MSDAWAYAAAVLADAGCSLAVGVPADEPGLLDAADARGDMAAFSVRDQRVGASLAAGYALLSGRPCVLALTTGPAFTNALAGLHEAASACAPVVVVTTRVAAAERGRGAFQEVDQRALAATFAKACLTVEEPRGVRSALRRAVAQAVNGRPGVVVVELAPECLVGLGAPPPPGRPVVRWRSRPDDTALDRAAAVLAGAARPVVVLGGGARGARDAVARLAAVYPAAYGTTASGRGAFDEAHPLACGTVGLYATPPFDALLDEADVVLAVGSRLEETMRMRWPGLGRAALVHADCDAAVLGRAIEPAVALVGDAAATCEALAERLGARPASPAAARWPEAIAAARRSAQVAYARPDFAANPVGATLRALADAFPEAVFVQENGLQDLWGYHYPILEAGPRTAFVAPGEQTMMGFGVGAAVGAAVAAPERVVIGTCGDGALGMSLAALPSAAACGGRLLFAMWDDGGFGWPRLGRGDAPERRHLVDFDAPPPAAEAIRALGGEALRVASAEQLGAAVASARAALEERRLALLAVAACLAPPPPAGRPAEADGPAG